MNTSSSPLSYDIAGAAQASGIPESQLRQAVASGKIPAKLAGDRIVIESSDLAAFVAGLPVLQPARTSDEEHAHKQQIAEGLRSHGRAIVARVMPPLKPKGGAK